MPSTPAPAYRNFTTAAAAWLTRSSGLAEDFAYDAPANQWRHRERDDQWVPVPTNLVVKATVAALHATLEQRPDIPLEFRCVYAPPDAARRLASVTDWDVERDHLAAEAEANHRAQWKASETERRRAGMEPTPYHPLSPRPDRPGIGTHQRERLLGAVSHRAAREAIKGASAEPAFTYRPTSAPVAVDPRAWLAALPSEPGAWTRRSAVFEHYRDALPDDAKPLPPKRFHALAREVLGDSRKRHGHHCYPVKLPPPADD